MPQRALIVEDDPLIAIGLEQTLRSLGVDVCGHASTPQEAVELASSRRPDLVLMDVYLKEDRQGIKAAKWLRDACDIPVLFVTGPTTRTLSRASASYCRRPPCVPSPSIRIVSRKPLLGRPVGMCR